MAARITTVHEIKRHDRPNTVVKVREARVFAVVWSDSDARIRTMLALQFGDSASDGKPMVFCMADEDQMRKQLTVANSVITQGVRDHLESESGRVPEGLGVDVESGVEADLEELLKG